MTRTALLASCALTDLQLDAVVGGFAMPGMALLARKGFATQSGASAGSASGPESHADASASAGAGTELGHGTNWQGTAGAGGYGNVDHNSIGGGGSANADSHLNLPNGTDIHQGAQAGYGGTASLANHGLDVQGASGAHVTSELTVNQQQDLGHGVTTTTTTNVNFTAGADANGQLTANSHGVEVGGGLNAGASGNVTTAGQIGNEHNNVNGSIGISSPGSVGAGFGIGAHYNDGVASWHTGGNFGVGIFGINGGTGFSVDLKPLINGGHQIQHLVQNVMDHPDTVTKPVTDAGQAASAALQSEMQHVADQMNKGIDYVQKNWGDIKGQIDYAAGQMNESVAYVEKYLGDIMAHPTFAASTGNSALHFGFTAANTVETAGQTIANVAQEVGQAIANGANHVVSSVGSALGGLLKKL